ncbi:hypothetical protein E3Q11_02066 [Wallemia mellicola]|nr:hypothetical protein E3Q11_02066 [Wallemia mellicola]TIC74568.1 hypothetical protein E3Q00_01780 [Wallemia mellicola]
MTTLPQFYDLSLEERKSSYYVTIKTGHVDVLYAMPENGDPRLSHQFYHYSFKEHAHRSGDRQYNTDTERLRKQTRTALSELPYNNHNILQTFRRESRRLDKKYYFKSRRSLSDAIKTCYNKYLPESKAQRKRLVFAWIGNDASAPMQRERPPWAKDVDVPRALIDLKYEVVEINGYKTSTRCNSCNNPLKHCWTTNRDRTKFRTDTDQSGNYELIEGLRLCDSTECRNEIPADLQYRVLNIDKVTLCNATTIVNSVKRPQFLKYSSQNP